LPPDDIGLSVLARDIQALRRRADSQHWASARRARASLRRAEHLRDHLADGSLIIDPLWPEELPQRESLRDRYGIGRGEAASIVLAKRDGVAVLYLSPEGLAFNSARIEGLDSIVIRNALAA
jgi:hypothetical protein